MLAFTVSHEAWYWMPEIGRAPAEIMVMGGYDGGCGVDWEFAIRWIELQGRLHPKIEMFSDSWRAWHEVPELFGRFASMSEMTTPAEMAEMLLTVGLVDVTDRRRPAISR